VDCLNGHRDQVSDDQLLHRRQATQGEGRDFIQREELYGKRKEDARAGRKLPELRSTRFVSVSELIDDVLEYVADHKDKRSYISKAEIVRAALGSTKPADLKPQELSRWLKANTKTPATHNRYKAFVSLCYRLGNEHEKVDVNPAKKVRPRRPEGEGRQSASWM